MKRKDIYLIYLFIIIFTLGNYSISLGVNAKNSPPSIKSIKASKSVIKSAEKIKLTVLATDINKDKMTYTWSQTNNTSTMGSFSNSKSATTYWTAPKIIKETKFNVQVKVTDSKKAYTIKKIIITVKPKTLTELYNELKDSVVTVQTDKGEGTGFVMSSDGWILTNAHIIKGANTADVVLNSGRTISVDKLMYINYYSDWAIIKINLPGLKPLKVSKDSPKTGDTVFTISNPSGLGWSTQSGEVSEDIIFYRDEPHIQVTIPFKPENCGGPLFDLKGELLGVTTTGILDSKNINVAYPMNLIDIDNEYLIDEPLYNYYSYSSIMDRLDYMVDDLNRNNNRPANPLVIGKDSEIGPVDYYNDTWKDSNGNINYAISIGTSYQEFLNLTEKHRNEATNTFKTDFFWYNYDLAIDAMDYGGIDPILVYYLVVDDLDSPPPSTIIPSQNVTYINGKYHVEYYYYNMEVDKDLYYGDNWYSDQVNQ